MRKVHSSCLFLGMLCLLVFCAGCRDKHGSEAHDQPSKLLGDVPEPGSQPGRHIQTILSRLDDSGVNVTAVDKVTDSCNDFAAKLYTKLQGEPGNLFISPYSISTALAMAYEGAHGKTATEMETLLGFSADATLRRPAFAALYNNLNPRGGQYKLATANALWVQQDYPVLADYTDTLAKYYGGQASNLNFKGDTETARQTINGWVSDRTNDKIPELFQAGVINPDTRAVLTNAVYFKGKWLAPFDSAATADAPFTAPGGEVSVPMMHHSFGHSGASYAETAAYQALELPYDGEKLALLVLLPKGRDLGALAPELAADKLQALRGSLQDQPVEVSLPRFSFRSKFTLGDTLAALGMPSAFEAGTADFTGINSNNELYIGEVVHQAFVDVNEEGTEAAAATGVTMDTMAAPAQPTVFSADHPFLFLIVDRETSLVLFIGRMENPRA